MDDSIKNTTEFNLTQRNARQFATDITYLNNNPKNPRNFKNFEIESVSLKNPITSQKYLLKDN